MEIEAIAYFKSRFATKFGVPRQSSLAPDLRGEIHFTPKFRRYEALKGLDGFDWLWLIWGFSENRRRGLDGPEPDWTPTIRPPRLGGNATMGVFATRSPFRPNNLGLSSVRILDIDRKCPDAPVIVVAGADLCDGTPIYDIKPYLAYTDSHPDASGGFTDETHWDPLEVRFSPDAEKRLRGHLDESDFRALTQALSLDPRPHYHNSPDKVYGVEFGGLDVHFRVVDGVVDII